jgi:autotransporter-associated beta strand protein
MQLSSPEGASFANQVNVDARLSLSGTGINSTGALLDVSGDNTWSGQIILDANAAFSALSYPLGVVSFAVANSFDTLNIQAQIVDDTNASGNLAGMSSGVEVVGAGTVIFSSPSTSANSYQGTTYVQSGTLQIQDPTALGGYAGSGKVQDTVQRLTYFDPSFNGVSGTGQFTLSYNGNATGLEPSGVSATKLANDIANLPGIGSFNVAVTEQQVTPIPVAGAPTPTLTELIYTIVFEGSLAGKDIAQLVLNTITGGTGVISTVADGGIGVDVQAGAALQLNLAGAASQTVNGVTAVLNGTGPTGAGALENISGSATWQAAAFDKTGTGARIPAITLNSSSAIGVDPVSGSGPLTTLTVAAASGDLTGASGIAGAATASLSKVGLGTLALTTANAFAGTTQVQDGYVQLLNAGAGTNAAGTVSGLGAPLSNNTQTLTIKGSINGTFQVNFNGAETPPISADYTSGTTTRDELVAQLDNLSTIGGVGGSVNVVQVLNNGVNTNVFQITFLGSLAGAEQNPLTIDTGTITSGTTVGIGELAPGGRGYSIVSGGINITFQNALGNSAQVPFTVDASNLVGTAADPASTPFTGGIVTQYSSGLVSQLPATGADPSSISVSVATTQMGSNGTTGTPLTPKTNAIQTLYFNGTVTGGTFKLTFNSATTGAIPWSDNPTTLANNIQAALDQLVGANNTKVSVASPGAVELNGGVTLSTEELILSGNGPSGGGALESVGGQNIVKPSSIVIAPNTLLPQAPVILDGATSIGVDNDAGGVPGLTISQAITEIPGTLSPLTKVGAATLLMDGTTTNDVQTITIGGPNFATGSYQLTFNGVLAAGTISSNYLDLTATGAAQELQAALNSLVGSGNALVSQASNVLTVTFQGNLASMDEPTLGIQGVTAGTTVVAATKTHGFNASNTYQNLTTVANGMLQLGKMGGALSIPKGQNLLVQPGQGVNTIVSAQLVQDGQVDPGVTVTVGSAPGATNAVNAVFDANGHTSTIGDLVINDGTADANLNSTLPGTGVLTLTRLDMFGGLLSTNTIGTVAIAAGGAINATADATTGEAIITGSGGSATPGNDGTFTLNSSPAPTITVTAANLQPADLDIQQPITGTGGFTLAGTGILEVDADSHVSLTGTVDVTSGTLQVDGPATATKPVGIDNGMLGTVEINQATGSGTSVATLAGTGTVGNIVGSSGAGSAPAGTINPGDNGNLAVNQPYGILTTVPATAATPNTQETWGANTTLYLDLTHVSAGNPVSGIDNDEVVVDGSNGGILNLGGALLAGKVNVSVQQGDQFTIVDTINGGQIVGQFADPTGLDPGSGLPVAFIDGQKFDVTYKQTLGVTTSVVLTRVPETITSFTVASSVSNNTSVYGQDVTFTATLIAENGNGLVPATDTVTFFYDKGQADQVSQTVHVVDGAGQATATFDPQIVSGLAATTTTSVPHTIDVDFMFGTSDPNFSTPNPATLSPGWTVNPDPSSIALAPQNPPTTVYGQQVQITATVTGNPPGGANPNYTVKVPSSPSPNLTFLIDGGPSQGGSQRTVSLDVNGVGTLDISTLSIGSHKISAVYAGDVNYVNSVSTKPASVVATVVKDDTSVDILASPHQGTAGDPATYGQPVTFTAVIFVTAPGGGVPQSTDTVTFTDGNTTLGTSNVVHVLDQQLNMMEYEASITTSTLTVGTHYIKAVFSGDTKLNGSSAYINPAVGSPNGQGYIVIAVGTNVTVTSTANPSTLGQQVSFTAQVTANANVGAITGTVTFYDNGNFMGTRPVSSNNGTAVLTTSSLTIGTHTITATYGGNTIYAGNTGTLSPDQVVQYSSSITIVSSASTTDYVSELSGAANPLTFTATVVPGPGMTGAPTPDGTVQFYYAVGSTKTQLGAPVPLGSNGKATLDMTTLPANQVLAVGIYSITATYIPGNGSSFQGSTTAGSISQTILADTQTLLTSSQNPSYLGQSVTFTATITTLSPGNTSNFLGTVTFYNGSTPLGPAVNLTASMNGVATFSTSSLPFGPQSISAVYSGSNAASSLMQGDTSNTVTQSVRYNDTVTVMSPLNPSGYTSTVTFTATVSPTASGQPTPQGTITFYDSITGSPIALANSSSSTNPATLSGGQATFTTDSQQLSIGNHPITVQFTPSDANYVAGNNNNSPLLQMVLATSTTSATFTPKTAVFGQTVSLDAVVTPSTATAPTGTVTFWDFYGSANQVKVGSGSVLFNSTNSDYETTATTSTLAVGSHQITAVYSGDSTYFTSQAVATDAIPPASPPPTTTLVISKDGTNTQITSNSTAIAGVPTSVFSQPVIFTITVTQGSPGTIAPRGTVTITDSLNGGPANQIGSLAYNGSAIQFSPSTPLAVGSHVIAASFAANTNFGGSSGNVPQNVTQAGTFTTLTPSAQTNPSVFGAPTTYQVTVSASPGTANPTGSVSLYYAYQTPQQILVGSGTLSGGSVTINSIVTLPIGADTITAVYTSDNLTDFGNSSGTATQNVTAAFSKTVLQGPGSSSVYGQSINFQATVTPIAPGTGTPQGTVTLYYNYVSSSNPGTQIGSSSYSGGTVTIATSPATGLPAGAADMVTAVFTPSNTSFNGSVSAAVSQQVTADGTKVTVTSDSTQVAGIPTSVYSQPVTFTITVMAVSPGSGTPQGTVTLFDGTNTLVSGLTLSNGTVTYKTTALSVASHSITAQFIPGDNNFTGKTSAALTQQVNKDGTITTLAPSSANPAAYSEAITFTATVSAQSPGTATPTGTVAFKDTTSGATLASSVPLVSGQANFTTTTNLSIGTHNIQAVYTPDSASLPDFNGSPSTLLPQKIVAASTTTTLTSSSVNDTSVYSEPVTLTAVVAINNGPSIGGTAGTPTGNVKFYLNYGAVNQTTIGTTPASGAGALAWNSTNSDYEGFITTTTLPVGSDPITAVFVPSSTNFSSVNSTNGTLTQTVNPDGTTATLTASPNPASPNTSLSFTVTVAANAPGTGTPSGTVTLTDASNGNAVLGTANTPLTNGRVTISVPAGLAFGVHDIHVSYTAALNSSNKHNFLDTSTDLVESVLYKSTTVVTSSVKSPFVGDTVTFTATVSNATLPSHGAPGGYVTFYDGTTPLGTGQLTAQPNGTSIATFPTAGLLAGSHNITAKYTSQDGTYADSVSPIVVQKVYTKPTSLTASASPATPQLNTAFKVTAVLKDSGGNAISTSPLTATITEVDSLGGLSPSSATVSYVNGAFTFSGLLVKRSGSYRLRVTVVVSPTLTITADVTFTINGRLS